MITFRINGMQFVYHKTDWMPFKEFVLNACDLVHDWEFNLNSDKAIKG